MKRDAPRYLLTVRGLATVLPAEENDVTLADTGCSYVMLFTSVVQRLEHYAERQLYLPNEQCTEAFRDYGQSSTARLLAKGTSAW